MATENRFIRFFNQIVTPKYQIIALLISSLTILVLSIPPLSRFNSLEPSPQIFSVTPKLIKEWGGDTTEVTVGLHIINFPVFDIVNNLFTIDAIIWFEFDPALVSLETIEKFSFEKGNIIKKTASDTKVVEGKFFAQYNITVKFTSNLSFQFFPLDDHRIFLKLTNKFVSPNEIVYKSYTSGFTLSEGVFTAGWKPIGRYVVAGYSEAQLDENDPSRVVLNPSLIFSIDFERSGIQQIVIIFLPLFLMFFIGILSFSLNAPDERRLGFSLSLGSVTAILSYRFVIQSISPEVGYFMLSDHIFTIFLLFAFLGFLLSIILVQDKDTRPFLIIALGLSFIMFHIMLLVAWYYLLYEWIKI